MCNKFKIKNIGGVMETKYLDVYKEMQDIKITMAKLETKFDNAKELINDFATSIDKLSPLIIEMEYLSEDLKALEQRVTDIVDNRMTKRLNSSEFTIALDNRIDEKVDTAKLRQISNITKWVLGVIVSFIIAYLGMVGG